MHATGLKLQFFWFYTKSKRQIKRKLGYVWYKLKFAVRRKRNS